MIVLYYIYILIMIKCFLFFTGQWYVFLQYKIYLLMCYNIYCLISAGRGLGRGQICLLFCLCADHMPGKLSGGARFGS